MGAARAAAPRRARQRTRRPGGARATACRGAGAAGRPLAADSPSPPRASGWSRSATAASSFSPTTAGANWSQAASVPTQALLTGVCFFDAQHGIAVGHDLVALATPDAGRTWQRTHYAPEAQRPLLDVWCGSDGRAIASAPTAPTCRARTPVPPGSEQPFTPAPPPEAPWRQGGERRRRTRTRRAGAFT